MKIIKEKQLKPMFTLFIQPKEKMNILLVLIQKLLRMELKIPKYISLPIKMNKEKQFKVMATFPIQEKKNILLFLVQNLVKPNIKNLELKVDLK